VLAQARTDAAAAEQRVEHVHEDQAAAAREEQAAATARDNADAMIGRLRQELTGFPQTLAAVEEELAALDLLDAQARSAEERLRGCRRARDEAAQAQAAGNADLGAATSALHAARDPLVPLGAPALDGDLLTGWVTLAAWARALGADRERQLAAARAAAGAAESAAGAARQAGTVAAEQDEHARASETAATRSEQQERSDLEKLVARIGELRQALAAAPSDADAAAELGRIDQLDAAAAAADAALREARTTRDAADRAAAEVRRDIDEAWTALRDARDPLVALQVPPFATDDLLTAWTHLVTWVESEISSRDTELPAAQHEATTRNEAVRVLETELAADLDRHEVAYQTAQPLLDAAPPAVSAALERARAEQDRLAERRDHAARLTRERDMAHEESQVARQLANLLRSDAFPRWLVASALDALVADASVSLAELSGGQYELTHDDGRFEIIDHTDADAHRPVKTLSGGETFQASLALALALSAQMSSLAAAGAARLDSIFLDEGFGTLDESTLETVATTLENLAGKGDRMVGIITHVGALAERVPVRFTVRRDQRTAAITRDHT
jgi:exonuclease SbcC